MKVITAALAATAWAALVSTACAGADAPTSNDPFSEVESGAAADRSVDTDAEVQDPPGLSSGGTDGSLRDRPVDPDPTDPVVDQPSVQQPDLPGPEIPEVEVPELEVPAVAVPEPLFPRLLAVDLPAFEVPGVVVGETGDGVTVFTVEATVLFDFDRSDLRPEAEAAIEQIVDAIDANDLAGPILVAGHTDSIGSDSYNRDLSEARSVAVAGRLRAAPALTGRTVTARGYGETRPVAPNTRADGSDDPDGRRLNRRVEIAVG